MADIFPQNLNVEGPTQLVQSRLNKVAYGLDADEGVNGEFEDALTLKLDDEELLELAQQAENKYRAYEGLILPRQKKNELYYLGKQNDNSGTELVISNNLMFEAFETFLAAALAKNPEPVVYSDNTQQGVAVSNALKTMLQYHADQLVYRRELTAVTRSWGINFIGVMKYGWDKEIKDITCSVRNPRNLIFNPTGFIDSYGDYKGLLGERITCAARELIELFPTSKEHITTIVEGRLGTDVTYTEWWNDDFTFITFKGKILDKSKNPFFNYPTPEPVMDPMGQPMLDESGTPEMQPSQTYNHFGKAKKPYTFLNVFSFQQQPHDVTGLIEQNIPNQNRITRRTDQIDRNLSLANNSIAFSEENFNQETAKQGATALQKGNPVIVPTGKPISEAIVRLDAPAFPQAAFDAQIHDEQSLRSIFGTEGITAQQPDEDQTARGMILSQQYSNDRIGGGIGDALEQFADNSFNWFTQLYYVFYDEPHFAVIMGNLQAIEYTELSQQDLQRRMVVSVSPDSMKGHDELTEMNQAVEFYNAGAIGPKTLLTVADFPDVDDSAADGVLWKVNPQAYLQLNWPDLAQQLQQMAQQQAQAQAQAAGMNAQATAQGTAQGTPPEPPTPPPNTAVAPAGSSLSQVKLPA